MAAQQRWGKRELERQFRLGAFEQAVLAPAKVSAALTQIHRDTAADVFKDAYAFEFLNLPTGRTEADLHRVLYPSCLHRRKMMIWPRAFWRPSTWTATGSSARPR